ncbi:hypothetical protein Fot_23962 [Forsythia ovata]|uniref:Uncharacterized protein n=1 Tax=Forsythia ovata TaxID=205694 RepID=A0ABD1U4V8_9LAMI
MSGFYFSSVPKLKIRRSGVVDDILPSPPVPSTASVLGVTILQTPETMVSSFSFIPPGSEVTSEVLSAPFPAGPRSGKRNVGTDNKEGPSQTSIPHLAGKYEYINIGSRRDELDPTVLVKLPASATIPAASVHKYWTSTFGNAVNNVELTKLLKLAKVYTSRSHMLNYELYKVLTMKVDELRSTVGRDEDVNTLRS